MLSFGKAILSFRHSGYIPRNPLCLDFKLKYPIYVLNNSLSCFFGTHSDNTNRNRKFQRSLRTLSKDSGSSEPLASISITKPTANTKDIVPVALISSHRHSARSLKILLIPINLCKGDEGRKKTIAILSAIRRRAKQIQTLTDNLTKANVINGRTTIIVATNKTHSFEDVNKLKISKKRALLEENDTCKKTHTVDGGFERTKTKQAGKYQQSFTEPMQKNYVLEIVTKAPTNALSSIPQSELSVSSLQLVFDMNMMSIMDEILSSTEAKNYDLGQPNLESPNPSNAPKNTLLSLLEIYWDMISQSPETAELCFNALILNTMKTSRSRCTAKDVEKVETPSPDDNIAHVSENTTLQKAFVGHAGRMAYSTKSNTSQTKANKQEVVCVRKGEQGCVSPGNADNPEYAPNATKAQTASEVKESIPPSGCAGKIGDIDLLSCDEYKKSIEKAAKLRAELKDKKCKDSVQGPPNEPKRKKRSIFCLICEFFK